MNTLTDNVCHKREPQTEISANYQIVFKQNVLRDNDLTNKKKITSALMM